MTARGARYEKLAAIASGGMATVHLGRATGVGGFERFVAIKEMHPHIAREQEFVKMFLDEARLAARIHHPNVVATIDVTEEEEEGALSLIMEFVEGPTLQQVLRHVAKSGQPMELDVVLRILVDTLAGLEAAHELQDADGTPLHVVHRDMSPQNIIVSADGTTKIMDFGVARAESRLSTTRTGSVKGKVPYMSPEQIRSKPIDRRTDIYAAGVVLWEMLTARRFVTGDNEVAMIFQVTERPTISPREARADLPEPIALVCERALSKAAEDRFSTAAEFAEAIETAARECGVVLASTRAVSAYVRGLALHRVPADFMAEVRKKGPPPRPEGEIVSQPGSSRAQTAVTSDTPPEPATKKPFVRTAVILAGTVVVCAVAVFLWLSRGPSSAQGSAIQDNAPPGETSTKVPPPRDSAMTEPVALPMASASPSSSSSAQATLPSEKPAPSASTKPISTFGTGGTGGTKSTSKGGYRPREL